MSRSRWGGFRGGFNRYKEKWNELRTQEAENQSVAAPTSPIEFDYTTAQGIWNLNSTIQFKKSNAPAVVPLSYTFVDSSTSADSATITIPVTAQAGDIAILFDSTATGETATPSGWASIYQQNATFETSVSYKILQSGEPGTSITGQTNTTYSVKTMLVFRPSASITTVTPSSVNASGETSVNPSQQAITVSSAPAIVLGITRAYQQTPFISETFWSASEIYILESNGNRMKVYYEIQNSTPTSRTITSSGDYGTYNFTMGFTINAS